MFDSIRNLGCHDDDDCHGGFRRVGPGYVEQHCPRIGPVIDEPLTDAEAALNDEVLRLNRQRRDALANTVYPCPTCNPDQYLRWVDGDWPRRKPVSVTAPVEDEPVRVGPPERADLA